MIIKFFPEFCCFSLWVRNNDGTVENIDPNDLPINEGLKEDIMSWEQKYDDIYNESDPKNSKFDTVDDEIKFWNMGGGISKKITIRINK